MQAPERREQRRWKYVSRRIRRPAEHRRRLSDVIAHEPRLGERTSQAGLVLRLETGGFQRLCEHRDSVGMAATLESRSRACQRRLEGDGDHGREYTTVI